MTDFPEFIHNMPALDVPFPDDIVETSAARCDQGVVVFFSFHQDVDLPAHSHGPQWGTVIVGQVSLTIDGTTTAYGSGESYYIPSGVEHAVHVTAGSRCIDVFEEPDRYPLRG